MPENSLKITKRFFELTNSNGNIISFDIRYSEDYYHKVPLIIICPGFMAFKDWGPFPYFGQKFAENKFASIVLNYSHNGVDKDSDKITDFEKFASNTISKELSDIDCVINAVLDGSVCCEKIDKNTIGILGHSRGAANAIITAATDLRIKFLITLASISHYDRWTEHQKEIWYNLGYLPLSKDFGKVSLRINIEYLKDIEKNKEKFNIIKAAQTIKIPWLIVHGEEDLVVPIIEAEEIFRFADKSKTSFFKMEKVGHTLGAAHPFNEENQVINQMLDKTINWLQKYYK